MFSKLSNFIGNNVFFVSRQKTLLKKRKMTSKKQKVAKKKFLEQNPQGSYTNELKILQIQKQLDRKVNKNHHLNQLMDELFYPDVRYANEKLLQQNLLNLANNPRQALSIRSKQHNSKGQQQQSDLYNQKEQQQQQIDPVVQQIYLCQIPSQLFQLYLKNSQLFTHNHLVLYLDRLGYYFKNKSIIQDRVTYKWKQSLEKLKITDADKKKKRRCPYIFIEQEELIRDEEWNKVVKDINRKILLTTEQIANQQKEEETIEENNQVVKQQSQQQLQENYVDEDFYSLYNNCQLVLKIKQVANYVPEELFEAIVKKMLVILEIDNKDEKSQERLPLFSYQQKVKLLKVLSLKSMTKSTMTKSLHIDSIELSQKEEQKIIAIGKKLCEDILNSNHCSAQDLGAVIKSDKGQLKFLNSMLLDLCKQKMLKFLSSTSLQRSIDYLTVFWQNGTTKDANFIQVLVFDIYRKLPYSTSKTHLLSLFHMIKDSKLHFRQSKISISVSEIYPRFAESVAKYLNKNQLSHEEIKSFVNSIYENYPLYKRQSSLNILEMITSAIVKIGQGFRLQEISQLLFKTTVMGHRSRVFSKYVFQRYLKEYRKLMKQYKESRIQLIPDKSSKPITSTQQPIDNQQLPSMNEVILQQSLIMMLWSFIISFNSQNTSLPLSQMIEIYPVHIRSQDPMIDDLIDDLNVHLKDLNYFPTIKNKEIYQSKSKDNRRRSLKAVALLLKTNTLESYRYRYNEDIAGEVLQKLEDGKEQVSGQLFDNLVLYLMRYYAVMGKIDFGKLPDRWNDSVQDIFQHRFSASYQIKKAFLQNIANPSQQTNQTSTPPLAKRITNLIQQHSTNLKHQQKHANNSQTPQKSYKLYQLL